MSILEIKNLAVSFSVNGNRFRTVNGVDLSVDSGKILGIVGESGCGKTLTSLSIMGLIPFPGKIDQGAILFEGDDLLQYNEAALRKLRGSRISMIFQEPMTSLNPVFTVGHQITEVFHIHQRDIPKMEVKKAAMEMLRVVGITAPEKTFHTYPHQLSGGMRQRVMIAMALACRPRLLIADEPTTALDVTIQAQVLELIKELRRKFDTAILFITHDLGVIAEVCDQVAVMYAGYVVEEAPVKELFATPLHPYTQGLIASIPNLNEEKELLYTIKGTIPSPTDMPEGCRFHPRCPRACEVCRRETPELREYVASHHLRCWLVPESTILS
ncbi:oligopeptide transport ATP-binding protein AppD [Treponema primitia ZAS-2]|uniref:Oligopeptide transport ATP-binding protein AppD n=1 Tax=Treponema primitia (strain ATCC BAA-887 / DSM 12427 / ZAS-2) TaxID=545694 RepID=F5YI65_TREPZ|nr:ABC transporter ATP-binding protein [Treponema primitia]AEF84637.1 oligopeptide transport ATP-binding protein AppD [Treponema primitia ZAS-2]